MIHLIGLRDHHCHGVLVLRSSDGKDGQSGQRQVIHTTANTALVVAVRIQAKRKQKKSLLIFRMRSEMYSIRSHRRKGVLKHQETSTNSIKE